jgi:ATP-dependent Clp protease protease subunit
LKYHTHTTRSSTETVSQPSSSDNAIEEPEEDLPKEDEIIEEILEIPPVGWSTSTVVFYGLETRSILLSGPVDEAMANGICSQLQLMDLAGPEPIRLWINTGGGSIVDALAIYDTIKIINAPVLGVVCGACYSAGLLIVSACDFRIATPRSTFFYHQPIMSSPDVISLEGAQSGLTHYLHSLDTVDEIIKKRTGISKKIWKKHFLGKTSKHFSVKEALKWGFIDDLLEYADKPVLDFRDG